MRWHDPKGSHYDWFEIICNSVVRGFSLVPSGASDVNPGRDPKGSHYTSWLCYDLPINEAKR